MIHWKIYYVGGATFSSNDGEPWQAPRLGVLAIVSFEPDNGREILARKEFYWWDGSHWFGGDNFGLWDHLIRADRQCALAGRYVANAAYVEVIQYAINDPDFPPKTADNPGETY